MKLKEKFENEILTTDEMFFLTSQCEIIADELAIGFAEWMLKNYDGIKSAKELLEIYKKEKGL